MRSSRLATGTALTVLIAGFLAVGASAQTVVCAEGEELAPLYDQTASCVFERTDDMDEISFEGTAGTEIRLLAVGISGFVAPTVVIREPDGDEFFDGSCGGGCDFTLTESGAYQVTLSESQLDNTGSYQTHLACLAGSCLGP